MSKVVSSKSQSAVSLCFKNIAVSSVKHGHTRCFNNVMMFGQCVFHDDQIFGIGVTCLC